MKKWSPHPVLIWACVREASGVQGKAKLLGIETSPFQLPNGQTGIERGQTMELRDEIHPGQMYTRMEQRKSWRCNLEHEFRNASRHSFFRVSLATSYFVFRSK